MAGIERCGCRHGLFNAFQPAVNRKTRIMSMDS
jgi:hypothetical protein